MQEMGTSISKLILLSVDDNEIVTRLLERGKTSGRSDDQKEDTIRNRIKIFKNETSPVFDYYAEQEKAVQVEGIGSIDDIFSRLSAEIDVLV